MHLLIGVWHGKTRVSWKMPQWWTGIKSQKLEVTVANQPSKPLRVCPLHRAYRPRFTSMEPCARLLGRNCMKKGRGERKGWRGCIWPHFNNYRDDRWEGRLYSFTIIDVEFSEREDNSTPLKLSWCRCTHGYSAKHPNGGDRYSIQGLQGHRM